MPYFLEMNFLEMNFLDMTSFVWGDVAPTTLLGGHTTFATQTQRGGHTNGYSEGKQCSAQKFHGGASKNRTCDLILIRDAL